VRIELSTINVDNSKTQIGFTIIGTHYI